MKRVAGILAVMAGVGMLAGVGAGVGLGEVTLVATGVEEVRSLALVEDHIMREASGMKLTVVVKGKEAAGAAKYGELVIEEAVDDQGTDLRMKKDVFDDPARFREFANAFLRKSAAESKRPVDLPEIELKLGVAKRGAVKIARLRGSLSLATAGTVKEVESAGWKGAGEKKIEVPKEAGMGVTLVTRAGEGQSLAVELTGDENALEGVVVVDGNGNEVSTGMSQWATGGGPVHRSLDLSKPLDETMKVVVKYSIDRKVVKVLFDLKDVKLP